MAKPKIKKPKVPRVKAPKAPKAPRVKAPKSPRTRVQFKAKGKIISFLAKARQKRPKVPKVKLKPEIATFRGPGLTLIVKPKATDVRPHWFKGRYTKTTSMMRVKRVSAPSVPKPAVAPAIPKTPSPARSLASLRHRVGSRTLKKAVKTKTVSIDTSLSPTSSSAIQPTHRDLVRMIRAKQADKAAVKVINKKLRLNKSVARPTDTIYVITPRVKREWIRESKAVQARIERRKTMRAAWKRGQADAEKIRGRVVAEKMIASRKLPRGKIAVPKHVKQ